MIVKYYKVKKSLSLTHVEASPLLCKSFSSFSYFF